MKYIKINGESQEWNYKKISYEDIVKFACGKDDGRVYSITWSRRTSEGTVSGMLYRGQETIAFDGMSFNCYITDNS